ncbi:hypothetical protein ScPMuIL_011131 [Solemya velum]
MAPFRIKFLLFIVLHADIVYEVYAATCRRPPAIDGARKPERGINEFPRGTVVKYKCEAGYRPRGNPSIVCTDGQWLPYGYNADFVCRLNSCPMPDVGDRVIVTGADYTVGTGVSFSCPNGYTLQGESRSVCQADGTWDSTLQYISCQAVKCPSITFILNGQVTQENLDGIKDDFDSEIAFSCDDGYRLVGPEKRRCLSNRLWSGTDVRCEEIHCANPGLLANGSVEIPNTRLGTVIVFGCNEGFTLNGTSTALCRQPPNSDDAVWSDPMPICRAHCRIPAIANSWYISSSARSVEPGVHLTFRCQRKYDSNAPDGVTCSDGVWSPRFPACTPRPCPHPEHCNCTYNIISGDMGSDSTFNNGTELELKCDAGYEFHTSMNTGKTTCVLGSWDPRLLRCQPSKCEVPGIEHGYFKSKRIRGTYWTTVLAYDSVAHNSQRRLVCNHGYFTRSGDVVCQFGNWKGTLPQSCEIKRGVGEICSGDVECQEKLICLDNKCSCPSHEFWDTERGRCQDEKMPNGECRSEEECAGNLQCVSDQCKCPRYTTWFLESRRCIADCPMQRIPHGDVTFTRGFKSRNWKQRHGNITHEEVIEVTCRTGYAIEGRRSIVCQNGEWSSQLPTCKEVPCSEIQTTVVMNVTIEDNRGWKDGTRVSVVCKKLYEATNGVTSATCRLGQWEPARPECRKVRCDLPSCDANSTEFYYWNRGHTIHDTFVEAYAKVGVRCADRHTLVGLHNGEDTFSYCTESGWTWALPSCLPDEPRNCTLPGGYYILKDHNGFTEISDGVTVTVSCSEDADDINISCNDGEWSKRLPRCSYRSACGFPYGFRYHLTYATTGRDVTSDTVNHGTAVDVRCADIDDERLTRTCFDGAWSEEFPVCQQGFCLVPDDYRYAFFSFDYVYLNGNQKVANGSVVQVEFECGEVENSQNLTCVDDFWSEELPVCDDDIFNQGDGINQTPPRVVNCQLPWQLNGSVENSDGHSLAGGMRIDSGETLTLTCPRKYEPSSQVIKCEDGLWNQQGAFPTCTPKGCKVPTSVLDEQIVHTGEGDFKRQVAHGAEVTLNCSDNADKLTFSCQLGIWVTMPMCPRPPQREAPAEFCPPPIVYDVNYLPVQDTYRVGDIVTVEECPGIKEFRGKKFLECLASGRWSGSAECVQFCKNGKELWAHTRNRHMAGGKTKDSGRKTLIECKRACANEKGFLCRSISHAIAWYGYFSRKCFLSSESRQTKPMNFKETRNLDYYERVCDDSCKVESILDGRLTDWDNYDLAIDSKISDQGQILVRCYSTRHPLQVTCQGGVWEGDRSVNISRYCSTRYDECEIRPGFCKNGGKCEVLLGQPHCECTGAWEGEDCSMYRNPCLDQPCLHSGKCIHVTGHDVYRCECTVGWIGDHCEVADACLSSPCADGFVCRTEKGQFVCSCSTGWGGDDCSLDIDECDDSPCGIGATCVNSYGNFSCVCPPGSTGRLCNSSVQLENEGNTEARGACDLPDPNGGVLMFYNNHPRRVTPVPHGGVLESRCPNITHQKFFGEHRLTCNNGRWDKRSWLNCENVGEDIPGGFCRFPSFQILDQTYDYTPVINKDGTIVILAGNWLRIFCKCGSVPGTGLLFTKGVGHNLEQHLTYRNNILWQTGNAVHSDSGVYNCVNNYHDDQPYNSISVKVKSRCPTIFNTKTLAVKVNSFYSGGSVEFSCVLNEQRLIGSQVLHCMDDGQWSNPIPTCNTITCDRPKGVLNAPYCLEELKKCSDPGTPMHGSRDIEGAVEFNEEGAVEFNEGSYVTFTCEDGYRLNGPSRIRCREERGYPQWSASFPTCEPGV